MGKRTSQSVKVPPKATEFLDDLKGKLGIRTRGQVILYIANVWGKIILAHLDDPLGAVVPQRSAVVPQRSAVVPQRSAVVPQQVSVESAASNLQVKDPRMAKLEAAKSKLASK